MAMEYGTNVTYPIRRKLSLYNLILFQLVFKIIYTQQIMSSETQSVYCSAIKKFSFLMDSKISTSSTIEVKNA
jgi:hypothetical protein